MTRQPLLRCAAIALSMLSTHMTLGQQRPYTIHEVVREANANYPAIRVSSEQVAAAAGAIDLARTAYLPKLDFLGQANRATRNNMFGMVLPQSTLPGISGPPLAQNDMTSVWGSIVGLTVAWEPFDFGFREANVAYARAGQRTAEAGVSRTRLEVAAAAADAFLTLVAAEQTAIAAKASVERAQVLTRMVEAVVDAQLRPGADFSRARAESAVAENQFIRAQAAIEVARASLAQFLGVDSWTISTEAGSLLKLPGEPGRKDADVNEHPLIAQQRSVVEQIQANQRILERSYYPRFLLQGSNYARGTGALATGATLGGVNGLGPNIYNWGVGISVVFPLFDLASIRVRQEIETFRERSESARLEQFRQELNAAVQKARANLDGARRVAQNTPIQFEAALATERQTNARYKSGLGTLIEVADAQRLVTQAEIDDALARLGVWRAMLQVAAAEGDLELFLQQVGK